MKYRQYFDVRKKSSLSWAVYYTISVSCDVIDECEIGFYGFDLTVI